MCRRTVSTLFLSVVLWSGSEDSKDKIAKDAKETSAEDAQEMGSGAPAPATTDTSDDTKSSGSDSEATPEETGTTQTPRVGPYSHKRGLLGHGGLCKDCSECTYPHCPFGKGT